MIRKKIMTIALSAIMILSVVAPTSALGKLERIKGKNNYETAVKIADKRSYSSIVLVNMDKSVADGLSAASLAGANNGVILLTSANKIPTETQKKIDKVKKVYIIGNEKAISKSVENSLKSKGKTVTRLGGNDRYETSYKVAKEVMKKVKVNSVFVANGLKGEADIVSASPISYRDKAPILLTNGKKINTDAKNIANSVNRRYIIGGNQAVSVEIKNNIKPSDRLGGRDRHATNKIIIEKFYKNPTEFNIVDKNDYIVASVACSISTNSPLVLIDYKKDPEVLRKARKIRAIGNIPENSIAMVVGHSGGMERFDYSWTKNRLIAHAMGGIDGKDYTNSKEAMEYNYKRGIRVFEVDINVSKDDKLIAWHSFAENALKEMDLPTKYSEERPTLKEFKKLKPYGKYETMSFSDIVKYMESHKDMYLVIDSKTNKGAGIKEIYQKIKKECSPSVLERIIPQAYNEVSYKRILDVYQFKSMIVTCYIMQNVNMDRITNLCALNGVKVLTVDGRKYSKAFVDRCNTKGIKMYMNTYNDKQKVDELKEDGVYGFYTDFLAP